MKKAIITTFVLIVALVSVFCLVACGDGATDDVKPEEDKIVGMWSGVVTENNSEQTIVKGFSYHLTVTYNAQKQCFDFSQYSVFNHVDPDALYGSRTITGRIDKNAIDGSLYSMHTSFMTSMLPEKHEYDIQMESENTFIVWMHSYGNDANKERGGKLRFERTEKTVEEFIAEIKNNQNY